MSKREKRLQKLRQNPKNVSLAQLRQVLEDYGFTLKRISGSHHFFEAQIDEQVWKLTIPRAVPIKLAYVKQSLAAIDEIRALEIEEKDDDESTDQD